MNAQKVSTTYIFGKAIANSLEILINKIRVKDYKGKPGSWYEFAIEKNLHDASIINDNEGNVFVVWYTGIIEHRLLIKIVGSTITYLPFPTKV